MIRLILVALLVSAAGSLPAQLRVGGAAGAGVFPVRPFDPLLPVTGPGTRVPAPWTTPVDAPAREVFDFAATKPYLAFFCRLELDIEEATRFPVRFRLGEVRTWQQELTKRD